MLQRLRDRLSYGFILSVLAGCGGGAATTAGTGVSAGGCSGGPDPHGMNENQQTPGDQPGGVAVEMGDIAVSPDGTFVVFTRGNELAVGWPATGLVQPLPVSGPTRLAFAKGRPVVYVGSSSDSNIHAIDVQQRTALWKSPISSASWMRIGSTADDTRVVASSLGEVWLIDAATGERIKSFPTGRPIVDLEILPDDARALVVTEHQWQDNVPSTEITVLHLDAGARRTFDVPNCADNIVVTKGGGRAFLAPSICTQPTAGHDPISLVDLAAGDEQFVRNLPGFGPVALGPDGTTAVGFLDRENVDASLFDDPAQIPELSPDNRYDLMVIDTEALTYQFYPVGQTIPRYAMTPDGEVLLVDAVGDWPVRLFDTETGTFRDVAGPQIWLDDFVLTSDAKHAYALWYGLFDLDIEAATTEEIPTGFEPLNINIAPGDRTLFLRKSDTEVCVFSLVDRRCGAHLSSTPSL
jgi:DNA-binding beta-propeller fold protein YncE